MMVVRIFLPPTGWRQWAPDHQAGPFGQTDQAPRTA